MVKVNISLDAVSSVKSFVNMVSQLEYDVDLVSDRYVVDAKSIMGIFSLLDLSKPIELQAHTEDGADLMEKLKPYLA